MTAMASDTLSLVMAGLVPAIPLSNAWPCSPKRDHRHKPGDDDKMPGVVA